MKPHLSYKLLFQNALEGVGESEDYFSRETTHLTELQTATVTTLKPAEDPQNTEIRKNIYGNKASTLKDTLETFIVTTASSITDTHLDHYTNTTSSTSDVTTFISASTENTEASTEYLSKESYELTDFLRVIDIRHY